VLTPPARSTTQPGPAAQRIGDYRLLARIGEGGMGVVHLAQAPDGSRVALKVLRQHVIGDHEARERLAREVASLRRVRSPRVAEVLDADPWGETPFVATRYVPGLSLHEHVREEGPIIGPDLAHLATGLVEAVIAVHQVGVLHRDIKPSNVLLEGRSPVLIDFGLARLAEDPRLTQTGWLLGTPGYLAPEILYGDDATPASDVHSWAATMVFAATGRPPFGTGPAMAIMDRVRRGEHDLTGVPSALLPLVRRCLAPEPADRPGTFAVLDELRRTAPPARPRRAPVGAPADTPRTPETMPVALLAPDSATLVTRVAGAAVTGPAPLGAPQPAPPQAPPPSTRPVALPVPEPTRRPTSAALPRLQRGALLGGLAASVAVGFARAPYLSMLAFTVLALLLRGYSRTSESARDRQLRRGSGRWYDAPLTVLSAPWYLLVAAGGTLVLLVCSALVALAVGCAYVLFRAPLVPGLVLMGAAVAASLWWGPGSRRVRAPTRALLLSATRTPALGWCALAAVAVVALLCGYELLSAGVSWAPAVGAPWRAGTSLGDLLRWL
jgi:predicted Ser/Thr protein kinase